MHRNVEANNCTRKEQDANEVNVKIRIRQNRRVNRLVEEMQEYGF